MRMVSNGTCQLDLSYFEMCMKGAINAHHLTMGLDYIDNNGEMWETGKSPLLKKYSGLLNTIMILPETQWGDHFS